MAYDPADEAEYGSAPQTFGRAANLPPPPGPPPMDWTQGISSGILGGIGAGMRNNQALGAWGLLQRQQAEQFSQQQQAQYLELNKRIEARQQSMGLAKTLGDIFLAAPGYRGDLIENVVRAQGIDPKDPSVKNFINLAKKADEEDSAAIREMLIQNGIESPDVATQLSKIKNPAVQIEMLGKLTQQKQLKSLEKTIRELRAEPQAPPTATAPGASAPQTPQGQVAQFDAEIKNLDAQLAERQKIVTAIQTNPAAKGLLAQFNQDIDNLRALRGQKIQEKNQMVIAIRDMEHQATNERHFNQVRGEIAGVHAQAAADRKQAADDKEAPGLYADRSTGEIRRVTRGEKRDNPDNFKPVSSQDATTLDLLKTVMPQFDAMQELTDRVLAKHPKEHLGKIIQNYSKGRYGSDEDIAQLQQVGNAVAIELSRALSGSSRPAVQLFQAIQGKEVPGINVTRDVATRMIQTNRMAIDNRIKSILGQPQSKIETQNPESGPALPAGVKVTRTK